MTTITLRKPSEMETLALTTVMAASPVKTSKAYKDAVKLLDKNCWTAEEREAWVADRNRNRKVTMAPASKPLTKAERQANLGAATKEIVAAQIAKDDAKRNAKPVGPSLKDDAKAAEAVAVAETLVEERGTLVEAEAAELETENTQEAEQEVFEPATVELKPVSHEEMIAALAVIARATKQQAEALRKAAAERKKVAPEGAKVTTAKPLTEAQIKKAAEAKAKAEIYEVEAQTAMAFVGKGLTMSKKMAIALNMLKLPALRWLAKQYEGVEIPKHKRSRLDVAEFLRVALLTWKPKSEVKA